MASRCTKRGLGWVSGRTSSWKGWLGAGTGCPGKWWSHCPWKHIKDMGLWWLATWFSGGFGSVRLMVGRDYLKNLFLCKWFYETGHRWCSIFWHAVSNLRGLQAGQMLVLSHFPLSLFQRLSTSIKPLISKFLLNGNTRRNFCCLRDIRPDIFLVFLLWQ